MAPSAPACDCDLTGSLDNGLCDPVSGRCVCKENVAGDRCDRCKFGFYGFSQEDPTGCQSKNLYQEPDLLDSFYIYGGLPVVHPLSLIGPLCLGCRCNFLGSVLTPYPCDQVTGQCVCQRFAMGPLCDQCLVGPCVHDNQCCSDGVASFCHIYFDLALTINLLPPNLLPPTT